MSEMSVPLKILFSPIFFLLTLITKLDFVSAFDSIEMMVDYSQACLFSLLGYNLTFPVHSRGSILITGASTSIGGHCAVTLAEKGFIVFAGVSQLTDAHKLKGFISPDFQHNLIPVLLDVTKTDHIEKALQTVVHHFSSFSDNDKHLVGIINCVGVPCVGPLEVIQAQDWLKILNANTVGPFQVISTFMPLLRQSVGRVINLSSANTLTASPMNGVYTASKTALESATDTLRNEVFRFGISVSLVIPGSVDSTHYQRHISTDAHYAQLTPPQKALYNPLIKGVAVIERETYLHKVSTSLTTRAIMHALFSETPKSRYLVGMDSKITRALRWMFSDRILDWGYQVLLYQFEDKE